MIVAANFTSAQETSAPLRVALFADPGSTDAKSRDAIFNLLKDRTDLTVDKVTTDAVRRADFFNGYDVFILPGGTGGGEAAAIGVDAGTTIAQQVKKGKGLIAVCAGGYYVAQGWNPATSALDIINADNHDVKHWARGESFIAVMVIGQDDAKSSRTMWFENGPIFVPATMPELIEYTPLVIYVSDLSAKDAPTGQMTGRDAVIAAPFGEGRVVAFGPHPELSPDVDHWLINSIKWAAHRHGKDNALTADVILEGK